MRDDSRWNNNLPQWISERHYTKDEVDAKVDFEEVEVTVTYTDSSTETLLLLKK